MPAEARGEIADLIDRAVELDYGPSRTALLERAVRVADAAEDPALGFEARLELVDSAEFSGEPDKALVAFTWCLAMCDADPERFREDDDVLWRYKWIAASLPMLPGVRRAQIEAAMADLERRYRRAGRGANAAAKIRCCNARSMGELGLAREWRERWHALGRDALSDCRACDLADEVELQFALGEDEGGLAAAEPLLDGRLACQEVPHGTLGAVLVPELRLGRLDDAQAHHLRGYRMVAHNHDRDFLAPVADHITFLALTGNHDEGLALLERHARWAVDATDGLDRLRFAAAAVLLLDRAAAGGREHAALRLPPLPGVHPGGRCGVDEVRAGFQTTAAELAAAFDARNGNGHWTGWLASVAGLASLAVELPLARSGRRRRRARAAPAAAPPAPVPAAAGSSATPDQQLEAAERLLHAGDVQAALAGLRAARAGYEEAGRALGVAECDRHLGWLRIGQGDPAAADTLRRSRQVFQAAGDHVSAARCAASLALFQASSGQLQFTIDEQQALVEQLEAAGEPLAAAHVRSALAFVLWESGRHDQAQRQYELARGTYQLLDAPEAPWCDEHEGRQLLAAGRLEQAVGRLAAARVAYKRLDRPYATATVTAHLALALWDLERGEDAVRHGRDALRVFERLGRRADAARLGYDLALRLNGLGRPHEAAELLEHARDVFAEQGETTDAADAELALARVLAELGEPQAALEAAEAARAAFAAAGRTEQAAGADQVAGGVLDLLERAQEAAERYRAAQSGYEQAGADRAAARVQSRRGLLLGVLGHGEEGLDEVDAALFRFAALDDRWGVAWCQVNAARLLGGIGRHRRAAARCVAAIVGFDAVDDGPRAAEAEHLAGRLLVDAEQEEDALDRFRSALGRFERLGDIAGQLACHGELAQALEHLGRHDEARVHDEAAVQLG